MLPAPLAAVKPPGQRSVPGILTDAGWAVTPSSRPPGAVLVPSLASPAGDFVRLAVL